VRRGTRWAGGGRAGVVPGESGGRDRADCVVRGHSVRHALRLQVRPVVTTDVLPAGITAGSPGCARTSTVERQRAVFAMYRTRQASTAKVDLSTLTIRGVHFSRNVREAPGTIVKTGAG
jgi:hypothetical protein